MTSGQREGVGTARTAVMIEPFSSAILLYQIPAAAQPRVSSPGSQAFDAPCASMAPMPDMKPRLWAAGLSIMAFRSPWNQASITAL